MKKESFRWTVKDLSEWYGTINFPEYQREPNIWSKAAKQRLIDSVLREFDIASIYLYDDDDGSLDCIDGRQRLGAMMSFIGENPEDPHNGFEYKRTNEVFIDEDQPFVELEGRPFADIKAAAADGHEAAKMFSKRLWEYPFNVVRLSGSREPEEFNLQFTRLNLGTILNSGEKLHAMVGELRDVCFNDLGKHPFLAGTSIQTRRFAQEQVAAQILGQVFPLAEDGTFGRTRHFDLQRLFKKHTSLTGEQVEWISRTKHIMDLLMQSFQDVSVLKSRALTVSAVLLAWELGVTTEEEAKTLARFMEEFLCRLKWQVKKKLDFDLPYRYLIDFQRHVTQASVEKPAVEERARVLKEEFVRWTQSGELQGDDQYAGDPAGECKDA